MPGIERYHIHIATPRTPISERFRLSRDSLGSPMVRQDRRCNPLHGYLKDDRAARLVLSFIRSAEFVDKSVVPIVLPSGSIYLRSSTLTYLPPAARTSARLPGRTTSKQTPSVIRLLKTRANGWKIIDCLAGIPNSSSFSSICATSSTNGRIFWASCRETFSIFGMIVSTQSSIVGVRGEESLVLLIFSHLSHPKPRVHLPCS